MSFFNLFKKKTQRVDNTPDQAATSDQITWENTTIPDDFFTGYHNAIAQLEAEGKTAATETLRANEPTLQIAFIDRFAEQVQSETASIADMDKRTATVITEINKIRMYNKQMNINVRTHLAQTKKRLIGE